MLIDRYTKMILTIIAGCLVWLCIRPTESTVHAQGYQAVKIVGTAPDLVIPVGLVGTGNSAGQGWSYSRAVPVYTNSSGLH